VLPGDGHGPAVIQAAQRVLAAAAALEGASIEYRSFPYSGKHYLETGELCPDAFLEELRGLPAVLFGGVGHPDIEPGVLSRGILMRITSELDLYISERPVRLLPGVKSYLRVSDASKIDYVIIREHSGGLNGRIGGSLFPGGDNEVAQENVIYTRGQVERCLRYAFEKAGQPNRKGRLTLSGKSSLQPYSFSLWTRVFRELGDAEFPQIKRSYVEIDDLCMQLVREPENFDVVVTGNLTGDILSNVGAVSQGGAGYAPIGSIHPGSIGMFGPMRASAEFYHFSGLQANPVAAISSAAMLLRHIGLPAAARRVEEALLVTLATEVIGEGTLMSRFQTHEVADIVLNHLQKITPRP